MTELEFAEDIENAINIYEQIIGNYAVRTRQMIDKYGPQEALSKLVTNPNLQSGFKALRDCGKLDYTFEAIIIRHPKLFRNEIVEAAQWRLDNANNLL